MSVMEKSQQTHIQGKLFDFALVELVRQNREKFQPLWTVDSWVKFLIWMTLNCGLSGENESIDMFTKSLGSRLSIRMRRTFFERTIEDLSLQLMADPADSKVLVMPTNASLPVTVDEAEEFLNQVGLMEKVETDKNSWQELDAVIAIPWQSTEENN